MFMSENMEFLGFSFQVKISHITNQLTHMC
jgi:hypothetical protein